MDKMQLSKGVITRQHIGMEQIFWMAVCVYQVGLDMRDLHMFEPLVELKKQTQTIT